MRNVDVIVIGAGPAGVAAAITCAKAGLNALVVANEKKKGNEQPIFRPAESIHPGVVSLLEWLGAGKAVADSTRSYYKGIENNDQFIPFAAPKEDWEGNHIDRALFDQCLFDCALHAGVDIVKGEAADIIVNNGRIIGLSTKDRKLLHSTYTIDASGRKRVAGRRLKFKEFFLSPPLTAWTGVSEGRPGEFVNKKTRFIHKDDGWTWLAPAPPSYCSWTRLTKRRMKSFDPPQELDNCRVIGKPFVYNVRWSVFRPLVKNGIILAGDAAGSLDPAAGQGILNALLSGVYAAETVARILNLRSAEAIYLAQYDNWFMTNYEQKVSQLKSYYNQLL